MMMMMMIIPIVMHTNTEGCNAVIAHQPGSPFADVTIVRNVNIVAKRLNTTAVMQMSIGQDSNLGSRAWRTSACFPGDISQDNIWTPHVQILCCFVLLHLQILSY